MKKYIVEVNGTDYEVIIKDSKGKHGVNLSHNVSKRSEETASIKEQSTKSEKTVTEVDNSEGMVPVEAPMSGKILSIKINVGEIVKKGETIMTLEAMKMETEISAPVNGEIKAIKVGEGDNCQNGTILALIEEAV